MKDDSLYSGGMLPLVHSERSMAAAGRGWHRSGQNVAYFSNSIRRGRRKRYSTLTFTLVAEHDHDLVHVAHCYPYTYTDLQRCGECEPTDSGMSCVGGREVWMWMWLLTDNVSLPFKCGGTARSTQSAAGMVALGEKVHTPLS